MPHVLFAGKRCRPFIPDLGKVFLIRNGEVCEGTLISAISILAQLCLGPRRCTKKSCGKLLLNTVDTMSVTGRGRNQSFCSWQEGQNSNLDHLFLARIPKPKQCVSASLLVEFCHWWLFLWLLFHLHIRLFLARNQVGSQKKITKDTDPSSARSIKMKNAW